MRQILIQEGNSEVFICIDRPMESRIEAMKEAIRLLSMEVMRYEININRDSTGRFPGDRL